MAIVPESFLGRWAQRKADVRQGREPAEPSNPSADKPLQPPVQDDAPLPASALPVPAADPSTPAQTESDEPPLTLQDAQALGMESDTGLSWRAVWTRPYATQP